MISENIHSPLIESLNESFMEIVSILKTLGNENRVQILLNLLKGSKSFGTLVDNLGKKNTAVSNHLTQLLETNLIEKDYGIYRISGDGIEFMKAVDSAFQKSPTRQMKKFQDLQSRKISNSFLNRFSQSSPT